MIWSNSFLLLFLKDISHIWTTLSLIIPIRFLFGWTYTPLTSSSSKVFSFYFLRDFLWSFWLSYYQYCWYYLYLLSCLVYFVAIFVWSLLIFERIVLRLRVLFITWVLDKFWFVFIRANCLSASANRSASFWWIVGEFLDYFSTVYIYFSLNYAVPIKSKLFPLNLCKDMTGYVDLNWAKILV